jgi:hypothetical protein
MEASDADCETTFKDETMSYRKNHTTPLLGYRETEGLMPGAVALITINEDESPTRYTEQQTWAAERQAMYQARGMRCDIFTQNQWDRYVDSVRGY